MSDAVLAKGAALVELVKLARTRRSAFEPLLPPDTWSLVESRVLVGSWYPAVHLERLLVAADRVLGTGDLSVCRALGKTAAQRTLQTLYKSVVVPGDVVASLRLISSSWSLLHNTGAVVVEVPEDGFVRVTVSGFGRPSAAVCRVFMGWIEGKVEVAGGRCEVVEEECRLRGDPACVYGVRWTVASA